MNWAMNWAWATSLDQIWRSPTFPMWLTLAAAGFFGVIVLITLLRAEKSVANGALTVITLLAVGIAVAATIRGYGPGTHAASGESRSSPPAIATLPALACIDDLAGDTVQAACEKALFASAESTAAAVNYTAAQISRLTALGDAASAETHMTPELQALRRAIERDRYGLVAQVLAARDRCTPTQCAAFRALTDRQQIAANMDDHLYDGLVSRHALSWNAPPPPQAIGAVSALSPLPAGVPTGKPTNAEFPSSASTPPVSIMSPEPGTNGGAATAAPRPAQPATTAPAAMPAARPQPAASSAMAAAKKPAKPARPPAAPAPVQLAPPPAKPEPAASND